MQHEIDDRLATEILRGTVRDGDTVRVDLDDEGDGLTVTPEGNNA
jgi:ATP-dependent Clp protease ATP-binding subunit ClpB